MALDRVSEEEVMDQIIKSETETALQNKDTNTPCDQVHHASSSSPVVLVIDDSLRKGTGMLGNMTKEELEKMAIEMKPTEAPPVIDEIVQIKEVVGENDFGELGHTEEVEKAMEKAVSDVANHVPAHFHPVFGGKVKRHPHKRAISKEQRKELRDQGKAWWLK
jgi:hypothetical protein